MSTLTATNLSHSFGATNLFAGISITIPNDGKIGLVGPNGIGKTTLLLMLAKLMPPSGGAIHLSKGTRIGYLPQEASRAFIGQTHTVYEEMLALFAELRQQEQTLRQMEQEMAKDIASDELLNQYSQALEAFEHAGGYQYETRIKQTLTGLGFTPETMQLPLPHLSGGQKTRTLLARLLLDQPDLLILDEPTNHLDIEAVEWLENALNYWKGALLIVSHDRYFLDKVVNRIWEMSRSGIELYRGNYSHYVQQRQERWERRQEEFVAFKERMEKELDYIRRNIAGQNTLQAKGKLKRISRELKAVQAGGIQAVQDKNWSETANEYNISDDSWRVADAFEAIRSLQPPHSRPPKLNFRLNATHRSGDLVLRTQGLQIGYPGKLLFMADDLELRRQEVAALIGANGTGKTSFLRTITGELEVNAGKILLGSSLKIGYFAQAHERLTAQNQVLDELLNHHPMPISQARNYLARYLFRGDDIYKQVNMLSGGERGRLALALLALDGANFLLLDEPTNHLDIPAQEVLQEVLESFEGTILMVSHDRYLIDHLATQIWSLEKDSLRVFKGSYQEYLATLQLATEQTTPLNKKATPEALSRLEKGLPISKNAQKQREKALKEMENQIQQKEKWLADLTQAIQSAPTQTPFDKIQSLSIEYNQAHSELEMLMLQWEELANEQ